MYYIALTTNKTLIRRLHDAKSDQIARRNFFYRLTQPCIEIDTYLHQGRRKVKKIGGTSSNLVGKICPPLDDLPKIVVAKLSQNYDTQLG